MRNVAYKVKKDTGVDISHQTIENWILEYENQNKECKDSYSGYYIFDVEWVKIKGVWNYRFTLSTLIRILVLRIKYSRQ